MAESSALTVDLPAAVDARLASQTLTRGVETVHREEVVIGNPSGNTAMAEVLNAAPVAEYGLVTRNIPSGTQNVRPSDGTNPITVTFDVDSGAGTQYVQGVSLRKAAAAGSVEYGTNADPLQVGDAGGSLTIDGSVGLLAGTNNIGDVDVLTQPARSHTTDSIRLGDGTDLALVTAAGALVVDGSGVTQPVSGTVTGNQGTPAATANRWPVQITDGTDLALVSAGGALLTDASATTQPISGTVTANAGTGDFLSITGHTRNEAFKESAAIGGELDDTATTAATEGNVSPIRITAQRSMHVTLRDSAGDSAMDDTNDALRVNVVAGSAGGTEYTEDAVAPADPAGGAQQLVRQDTPATLTSANGDVVTRRGTNYGAAYTQIVTSSGTFVDSFGGSGGTSQADESAFTEGTTNFTPVGGVLNDTITSDPTEDQAATFRITAKRGLHVNLRDVGGTEIATAAAPLRIDPTGTTSQPVTIGAALPAGTNNIGDVDVLSLPANASVNVAQINGVTPLMGNGVTGTGSQRVTIASDNTAFAVNATLSAETTKVIGTVRNVGNVGGVFDAATDAAVPANALQAGGRAAVANPTAVAAGDLVGLMTDILGKQVTRAEAPRERVVQNTITLTATTETTLIAAGAAGVFRDLTAVTLANTSATGVRVDVRDATAGTVRWSFWVPATQTVGAVLRVPVTQTTAANNWTAQLSAAVTDVRIFAQSIETV